MAKSSLVTRSPPVPLGASPASPDGSRASVRAIIDKSSGKRFEFLSPRATGKERGVSPEIESNSYVLMMA